MVDSIPELSREFRESPYSIIILDTIFILSVKRNSIWLVLIFFGQDDLLCDFFCSVWKTLLFSDFLVKFKSFWHLDIRL